MASAPDSPNLSMSDVGAIDWTRTAILYEHTDIPEGMTIRLYREQTFPRKQSLRKRARMRLWYALDCPPTLRQGFIHLPRTLRHRRAERASRAMIHGLFVEQFEDN